MTARHVYEQIAVGHYLTQTVAQPRFEPAITYCSHKFNALTITPPGHNRRQYKITPEMLICSDVNISKNLMLQFFLQKGPKSTASVIKYNIPAINYAEGISKQKHYQKCFNTYLQVRQQTDTTDY